MLPPIKTELSLLRTFKIKMLTSKLFKEKFDYEKNSKFNKKQYFRLILLTAANVPSTEL